MLGFSSVSMLEALAGSWVSIFGVRRRLLCTMDLVFEALSIPDRTAILNLSPELKSELLSFALLGPLSCVNLRAKHVGFVTCTDSSKDWMAACQAAVPLPIQAELCRKSLRKSSWSRLLPPGKAWLRQHERLSPVDEMPGEVPFEVNPLWELVARGLEFSERWRAPIQKSLHINVTELRAHLREEKFLAMQMSHRRLLSGLDSQVCLGALVKGRSSSPALNREMLVHLPYVLGADIYNHYMYFPTKHNRSDGPTRGRPPEPPDVALPEWWTSLAEGSFEEFDQWCVDVGMSYDCFDLSPLDPGYLPALESNAQIRRRAKKRLFSGKAKVGVDGSGSRLKEVSFVHSFGVEKSAACEKSNAPNVEACDKGNPRGVPEGCKLSFRAVSILKRFNPSQYYFRKGVTSWLEPGGLDLFSGSCGVAREMVKIGCPWVLTFEWKRSASEDLLQDEVRQLLRELVSLGVFKTVGAALICASYSIAVTPPVRTKQFPRGKPGLSSSMRQKVKEGNSHGDFIAELIDDCEVFDVFFWIENPDTSWLWRQARFKAFRSPSSSLVCRFPFCRFGTRWRKMTRLGTNLPDLKGLHLPCVCSSTHFNLRGYSKVHKKSWTSVAEPYPGGVNRLIASACCIAAGWCEHKRLDIVGCARATGQRIGEAGNPGPRRTRPRSGIHLEDIQLISSATEALEARLLREFIAWCEETVAACSVEMLFDISPVFLVQCLRAYGCEQFRDGGALSNFRHVILAAQRWKPAMRVYCKEVWDLVSRWELSQPVEHRVPLPESVMKAMVCLAWQMNWFAWSGTTILCFYGAGRIGEILRCKRKDLLLPSDCPGETSHAVFLRLQSFKSLGRQPSRVQHMKINNKTAVKVLEKIYRDLPQTAGLFGASPSVYRRRWDFLLSLLDVPKELNLTPGGMRGGSAVCAYRAGTPIADLLWNMRLRQQSTLESYLQETAALGVLQDLPTTVRNRIGNLASLFAFLQFSTARDPMGPMTNS